MLYYSNEPYERFGHAYGLGRVNYERIGRMRFVT